MLYTDVALSLTALFGACAFFTLGCGLSASLSPLAALALLCCGLLAGGMLGVLAPAAWLAYAVCWGLGVWALAGCPGRTRSVFGGAVQSAGSGSQAGCGRPQADAARSFVRCGAAHRLRDMALRARLVVLAPGASVFWVSALALALRLAALQPEFLDFDEYSYWGTAAKLTCINSRLYAECATGLPWQMTEFPMLPIISFFVQFFGSFAAWKAILAVDLLGLAAVAAVVACAEKGGWQLWLPVASTALLAPFVLGLTGHTPYLAGIWLSVLGDVPSGLLFGGAVAFWFAARHGGRRLSWLMLPVCCLCAGIKNNTFVLGLAAAGIAAADLLLAGASEASPTRGFSRVRLWCGRAAGAAALLAAPFVQYLAWSRYVAALVAKNAAGGGVGVTSESLPAVLAGGMRLLLGLPVSDYYAQRAETFAAYGAALWQLFFSRRVSLVGSGAAVCGVILLLLAAAVAFAPGARARLRVLLAAVCSTACFCGYWVMLWFSYAFILKDSSPENPASYARYFGSYYSGWLLAALALLAFAAAARVTGPARYTCAERPTGSSVHGVAAARMSALTVASVFAVLVLGSAEPQFTVLGAPSADFDAVRAEHAVADWAAAQVPEDEKLFLVLQGDDGEHWFRFHQWLLPHILVYGAGGGTYGVPEFFVDNSYYQPYTVEEFRALVTESGAGWLFVVKNDETLTASYGALFSDGLAAAEVAPALYRVQPDGTFALAAVMESGVAG